MDEEKRKKVNEKVWRKFPEMQGKSPIIQSRPNGEELLVFETQTKLETGATMKRVVRVVVNAKGNVLKITTSR